MGPALERAVLGYSRFLWARFVLHQDLQTVLRCHLATFATLGGVPHQILYDRMKTAVTGPDPPAKASLQPSKAGKAVPCHPISAPCKALLSDEHFAVDGTLIEAWASLKSFKPKDDAGDEPPAGGGGRNTGRDFHGEKRTNATHAPRGS